MNLQLRFIISLMLVLGLASGLLAQGSSSRSKSSKKKDSAPASTTPTSSTTTPSPNTAATSTAPTTTSPAPAVPVTPTPAPAPSNDKLTTPGAITTKDALPGESLLVPVTPEAATRTQPRIIIYVDSPVEHDWTRRFTYVELENALQNSGQFTLLSRRQDINSAIKDEQGRAQTGITDPAQATQVGKQFGAKYVVSGNCVNITPVNDAGGFMKKMSGTTKLELEIQLQLVEVETSRVLDSKLYKEQFEAKNFGKAVIGARESMAMNSFTNGTGIINSMPGQKNNDKDAITEDTRKLIESYRVLVRKSATDYINNHCKVVVPLQCLIAAIRNQQVVIDGGANIGIKLNDEFEVYTEEDPIRNAQGKIISQETYIHARLKVVRLEPEAARAEIISTFNGNSGQPDTNVNFNRVKVGQMVRLKPNTTNNTLTNKGNSFNQK
jgi:hypothetical protein